MNNPHFRQPGSHESGVLQRIRKSLRYFSVDRPHVLLACSGGKDSVALAATMANLARINCLSLSIAHIHHGQHRRADQAVETVIEIGNAIGVPVIVHHLNSHAIAGHKSVGLEEALRRERYLALAGVAAEVGADCIALAHHQSDQAETLLLHLLRGTGVDGLAGMREWERRAIPWWDQSDAATVSIWRPFLREPATTVAEIAIRSGLPITEDPTNADTTFRRNAIRHDVLPVLEQIAPGSVAAIARSGEVVAIDAELLAISTNTQLANCQKGAALIRAQLVTLAEGWQHRVVRAWLMQSKVPSDITHNRVDAVIAMASKNRGGSRIQIGAGTDIVLENGMLTVESWQNRGN